MTTLITGADGFAGEHLIRLLRAQGRDVVGMIREELPRLRTLDPERDEGIRWAHVDITNAEAVKSLVRRERPERVFHLAALASVAESLASPVAPFEVNVFGTLHLMNALLEEQRRDRAYRPRVLVTASGEAYGAVARRTLPLTEDLPLEPVSPYAVSKAAQEMVGRQYALAGALHVVVTRAFNHTGPGQRRPYVVPDWALQLLSVAAGEGEPILRVGDLDVERDFADVRDVVRAYAAVLEHGEPGEVYNVCTGRPTALRDILTLLQDATGTRVRVQVASERLRAGEVRVAYGSAARIAECTGWKAEIPLEQTIADLVAELRQHRAHGG